MTEARSFFFASKARSTKARFDDFIKWAEPGGTGGFDLTHRERYERDDPFFAYGNRLLPHSHDNRRAWFVVSADVILTHCGEVKVTHLGEDDGLFWRRRC